MRKQRAKKPAATWQVQQAMAQLDDFITMPQIRLLTGLSSNLASAALYHLKKYGVVDTVVSEGQLWWFLTGQDLRSHVKEEVVVEEKPRKPRRSRKLRNGDKT